MTYDIAATSRRCTRTGRELQPGERHMVVLYDRDEKLVREVTRLVRNVKVDPNEDLGPESLI